MLRLALAVLLLVQGLGCASRGQTRPPAYEGYFGTFPSGMRLIVYGFAERGGASALHVSYQMGPADEAPGQEGIRELARRLSSLSRPEGPGSPTLGERFEVTGAGSGGGINTAEVYFTALNSTLQLPRLLELEALRMREPLALVSEAEFAEAREQMVRELHDWRPSDADLDRMRGALFVGHPYGRPLLGTEASLRALTLEAVRSWARAHYTPDRAVLVVMGGVPPTEVAAAVTRIFGSLAEGPVAKPFKAAPPPLPARTAPEKVVKRPASVGYPQLWMVWRAPGDSEGRYAEAWMMADHLRTNVLPFVAQKVRGTFADRPKAGVWAADGVTLIYVRIEVGHGEDVAPLVATVKDRLSFGWGEMMGDSTATKLRDRARTQAQKEAEQISPAVVAWYLRMTGRADIQGWPRRVATTPLSEIRGYAREYLSAEKASLLLLVPPEDVDLVGPPKI